MLHKPKGYVSATKDNVHPSLLTLVKDPYDRFDLRIAGRLDVDTTGLIILSTEGDFIHELTHPQKHMRKTYVATLDKKPYNISVLLKGVVIKDDKNNPYVAKALDLSIDQYQVTMTIDSGKYHQVKRMFKAVGYNVIQLKRISIGNLKLDSLDEGEYREIRKEEIYD
jgi:16S rRNA pseudouridine516 synthase